MIEYLDKIDKIMLITLNGNGDPYWDKVMWIYTGRFIWMPLLLSFLYYIFRKGWKEGLFFLLTIVMVIVLCDQISSTFFKPYFERLRPSRQEDLFDFVTIVNDYRGGRYGFVSSHAANSFGFAVFTSLVIRRPIYTVSFLIWAAVTSYSRIYLGVHFPGDILAGGMVGVIVAFLMFWVYEFLRKNYGPKFGITDPDCPYKGDLPKLTLFVLYVTVAVMLISPTLIYPYFLKH